MPLIFDRNENKAVRDGSVVLSVDFIVAEQPTDCSNDK